MNKQNILFGIIGLLAGLIIGFFWANNVNRNSGFQTTPVATTGQTNPQTQSVSIKETQNAPMMPEVAQIMEKAQKEPDNFEAQISAGESYLKIQNTGKAAEFFKRAAAAHHDTFQDLTTLGNAFFDIKNYEEAEKWYSAALAKNPDDVNVRTDLGSTFMERPQPDLDRAVKEYRTSLEKNPKHESTLFNLSIALMRKGDSQGANQALADLEKANPGSPLIAKLKEKLVQKPVN